MYVEILYGHWFRLSMPVEFRSTLVKWGNSVRLVLPKPIRDGMKLKAGDKTRVDDNRIYVVFLPS